MPEEAVVERTGNLFQTCHLSGKPAGLARVSANECWKNQAGPAEHIPSQRALDILGSDETNETIFYQKGLDSIKLE